jgi:hypothetical protein
MRTSKKQKQVSIEEYIEAYCRERRIRERYAVYVSPEMHDNLRKVAGLFHSEFYTTTSSLADAILHQHFREHREILNERNRADRLFPVKPRSEAGEPQENGSESCPDDDSEG